MSLDNIKDDTKQIHNDIKAILDSNMAYYKLWFFKVSMKSMTTIAKVVIIMMSLLFAILFASIAMALIIGKILDSYILGFILIAFMYMALAVVIFFMKPKGIEQAMLEKFSEFFFND